jgi:hypothetical protein
MSEVIKVLANAVTITANANVGLARFVRVLNGDANLALITVSDTVANSQIGTYVLGVGAEVTIQKARTDVISSNNSSTYGVKVTSSI